MQQLDIERIKKWVKVGDHHVLGPASIGTVCPHCSQHVVFTTRRRCYDQPRDTLSCSAECPACDDLAHFWVTELVLRSSEESAARLFMMPSAREFLDVSKFEKQIPEDLRHSYSSTLAAYKTGNIKATCVLFRSTLETFLDNLSGGECRKSGLVPAIAHVHKALDLGKPLLQLARVVEPDGRLDNLQSNSSQVDHAQADALMELLDRLLFYFFVIPEEFEKLDSVFNNDDQRTNKSMQD